MLREEPVLLAEDRRPKTRKKSLVLPSDFTEHAIFIPQGGTIKNFSFKGREYLRAIYNSPAKRKLLCFGRQSEKSTTVGNLILTYTTVIPYFRSLYVTPSHQQTKVFSRDRIKEPIELSPILRTFTNSKLMSNVLEKKFTNWSQITMRFAFLNADRTRGIPADSVNIDEIQDVILDNIPVIEECASHSEYKYFTYSGTPKSLDGPLETLWAKFSTQNEWVIPCRSHGVPGDSSTWHWNVLDEANIGKQGLICDKCGKPIFAADPDSRWASLNPNPKVEKPFESYRIPQIMVPWIDWPDIRQKQRIYSRARFYNEVLGRSYDSGTRPLTRKDIMDNCNSQLSMKKYEEIRKRWSGSIPIFLGVDWGCHDDQTRILTDNGFKLFRDVGVNDKVAQFDAHTRSMTFVWPKRLTIRDWDGELLHFKNSSLDMMLTDTHRMLVRSKSGSWHVEDAKDVSRRGGPVEFVGRVEWEGEEQDTYTLPAVPKSPGFSGAESITYPMDDWLEFLGYYLSEGGLCWTKRKDSRIDGIPVGKRPYCLKMSQRETVNGAVAQKIKLCMDRLGIPYSEFPNSKTGDLNWTICGKLYWKWVHDNIGKTSSEKRIPRWVFDLSKRQLQIIFDAMMLGDGNIDKRVGNFNGGYVSTSKGLCEDFQELCVRLGLRSCMSLYAPAEGNRKARYRISWSRGRDYTYNYPFRKTKRVPYKGKVYCCTVPNGMIVTERNGKIAFQGNSGENTFTVVTLGAYLPFDPNVFTYFYTHRFEGIESEPKYQLEQIVRLAREFNAYTIGVDYGGGHWPNDELVRIFGAEKVKKYQWVGNVKKKISFEGRLGVPRFLCHRTEIMSDYFNAIKRRNVLRFFRWEEYEDPFGSDHLNVYSEFSERLRLNIYKHGLGMPDDTVHANIYCLLASFFYRKRPDIVAPKREVDQDIYGEQAYDELEDLDVL